MNERDLFIAALQLDPAERPSLFDIQCSSDLDLRRRVELLLDAYAAAGSQFGPNDRTVEHVAAAKVSSASEAAGTMISGRYKLLEAIGEGGMGTVWVAEQIQPVRRKVALKLIKLGMDSKTVLARFEAERQALAVMDHPNIAKVLDGGLTESGRPFFVMEYVKGVSITEYCETTRLGIRERLQLFVQVCHAVQHAHQKGIIHRDLKPSNILVAPYDDKPVPKVIDFGLAKAMYHPLTERTLHTAHETVLGTPLYMSPEQAQLNNLDVDTRSDLYSLGVLLYELLTGSTPLEKQRFKQAAWDEVRRIIREEEPPLPSARLSSSQTLASLAAGRQIEPARLTRLVKGELDWIVMKALEKDRNRRYETASGFAMDVDRYLTGEPVQAAPASARYRIGKFVRKHRTALSTATVMLFLLLSGAAISTWQAVRATRAEAASQFARRDAETKRAEAELARNEVVQEQAKTQNALGKAVDAERTAKRTAANSSCDVAQQLCERNSVAQGLVEYSHALMYAHEAKDADLEDAIRWNIGTWINELHLPAYTIPTIGWGMAAFHPAGKILAVGCQAKKKVSAVIVRLYNAADGSLRDETLTIQGPSTLFRLAWEPSGERLGIYTDDGRVHLWKPGQPEPQITFPVDIGAKYFDKITLPQMAFNSDGSRLIAGTSQPAAKVFDTTTGKAVDIDLSHHGKYSTGHWMAAVDWSRDGTHLLTGSETGDTTIWDAKSGKIIREVQTCTHGLMALRFSPDKSLFACASGFGMPGLQIWDSKSGNRVGPPMHHLENLYGVDFSPDGKFIIAVDGSCEAYVWEVGSSRIVGAPIWTGGNSTVASFHPNGQMMLTVNYGGVHVWKLGTEMQRAEVPDEDPEEVRLAPYAKRLHLELSPPFGDSGITFVRRQFSLSPDGTRLIKFNLPNSPIELIDAKTFLLIHGLAGVGHAQAVYWRPDSREFVATRHKQTLIHDGITGEPIAEIRNVEALSAAFRPDGARFAIGTDDYHLRFFDTTTWKPIGPALAHTSGLLHSAYSRDGKLVFTADRALTTRLWHEATGKRIGPVLHGVWPRVSLDNRSFIIQDWLGAKGYRIPVPVAGDVKEVFQRVASLTNRQGIANDEANEVASDGPVAPPRDAIGPAEARRALDKTVILEMTIRSVHLGKKTVWLYLNSEDDKTNPKNFTVAVHYPTKERLKEMGLDREDEDLVGLHIRAKGKVVLHKDLPEIIVENSEQIELLSAKSADDR